MTLKCIKSWSSSLETLVGEWSDWGVVLNSTDWSNKLTFNERSSLTSKQSDRLGSNGKKKIVILLSPELKELEPHHYSLLIVIPRIPILVGS